MLTYILALLVAYLLGSVPTGFLAAKSRGVDIRTLGSGNIGATNVFRFLGKPAGIFVLIVDALKGWIAVVVTAPAIAAWTGAHLSAQSFEWLKICAGIAAVLGHNYTCWLHFKGGKGIATSAGVLIALVPWAFLIILGVWIITAAVTGYVSLASICAAIALPFAAWLTTHSINMTVITTFMGALAIYKHRANIKRLLNGTENRFSRKKASIEPPPQNS